MKKTLAVLGLAALTAPAALAADTWTIDRAHSVVSFQVPHIVTNVRGSFKEFDGTIVTDSAKPEASSVEFKVQVRRKARTGCAPSRRRATTSSACTPRTC